MNLRYTDSAVEVGMVNGKVMRIPHSSIKQEINITEEMNKSGVWKSLEPSAEELLDVQRRDSDEMKSTKDSSPDDGILMKVSFQICFYEKKKIRNEKLDVAYNKSIPEIPPSFLIDSMYLMINPIVRSLWNEHYWGLLSLLIPFWAKLDCCYTPTHPTHNFKTSLNQSKQVKFG